MKAVLKTLALPALSGCAAIVLWRELRARPSPRRPASRETRGSGARPTMPPVTDGVLAHQAADSVSLGELSPSPTACVTDEVPAQVAAPATELAPEPLGVMTLLPDPDPEPMPLIGLPCPEPAEPAARPARARPLSDLAQVAMALAAPSARSRRQSSPEPAALVDDLPAVVAGPLAYAAADQPPDDAHASSEALPQALPGADELPVDTGAREEVARRRRQELRDRARRILQNLC